MGEQTLPAHLTGSFLQAVHRNGCFDDGKRFADAVPRADPEDLTHWFERERSDPDFDLHTFVGDHFDVPADIELAPPHSPAESITEHITTLWKSLHRPQERYDQYDTLIPLPNDHIVPGGRFREGYYWDSYFIAEGMAATGRYDVVRDMVENFGYLIERYGYVPNGNRRYYLGRSQLPLFSKMIELLGEQDNGSSILEFLPALATEYRFWMDGNGPGESTDGVGDRVLDLGPAVLNRYWDDSNQPRPESYRRDYHIGQGVTASDRPALYRDIRAACESGWDFSSRWLADPHDIRTIRTTSLLPVDLNASLWYMERKLADWSVLADDYETAERYREAAETRRRAITAHCWDHSAGYFFDYAWTDDQRVDRWTLAGVAPLFFGLATPEQAKSVAATLENRFLEPGGLCTTLTRTNQQWDAPNGWAPLQWMAVHGLRNYGHVDLADLIKQRWLTTTQSVFDRTGELVEKYDVTDSTQEAGGGEYPPQQGFAWTNAVVLALEHEPRSERLDTRFEPGMIDDGSPA